jgi:hypothetical protein
MEVIQPSHYRYCSRCPLVGKRVEEVAANPARLDSHDDFSVDRLEIICEIVPGQETNVYMSDKQSGKFTYQKRQIAQRRPGKLEEVRCPHWKHQWKL